MELIIIGVFGVVLGLLLLVLSETEHDRGYSMGIIICGVAMVLISFVARKAISEAKQTETPVPIEYPASEYELKLRITEFEEQRDTTYVLIPKNEQYLQELAN